jgi:NAD(P)-dependent dehydrogenase (short-subunit alcohol dehydrogenase family)
MYSFHEGYQKVLGVDETGIPGMSKGVNNAPPMQEVLDLTGKVAIVTGGAMGLGFCTVNRLCEAGASVVIADVAVEYANRALEYFAGKGYNVKFVETDLRDVAQIKAAVAFTVSEFGKVDILVNNAGVWIHALLSEITEDTWQEIIDINLKGALFFVQAVVDVMEKQETGGRIVNIASVAALSADVAPIMFEYVASKSAVVALTKSLARDLKPKGIRVNCVLPGGMLTPGAINTYGTDAAKALRESTRSPLSDPDEVARVVFMMATPISDFMYGATISVDGGAFLGLEV